jgi:hypothetical protein
MKRRSVEGLFQHPQAIARFDRWSMSVIGILQQLTCYLYRLA